jgi:flagellar basal-body rod modification protein FlgD
MIDSIGAGDSQQAAQADALASQSSLGQEEFLEILLTQLTFQDPLKPLDNQEFIAQMAQFTNLEQTRQLSENTDILLTVQSATQAIGLIGKTVTVASDSEIGSQTGRVSTISFDQGVPRLSLVIDDDDTNPVVLPNVSLADVLSIRE